MEPKERILFDCRLVLPNHALFIGGTGSGKTTLVLGLLNRPHLFNPKPTTIIFYYDQLQSSYLDTKKNLSCHGINMLLHKGFPTDINLDNFDIPQENEHTIVIIDDFSEETSSSKEIARIVTNGRHKNLSVWLIWHSLYSKYPESRLIAQNIRWFFFLPSLRLSAQLKIFGRQFELEQRIIAAFKQCQASKSGDFRYICVDAGPNTPEIMYVRSRMHSLDYQYCFK